MSATRLATSHWKPSNDAHDPPSDRGRDHDAAQKPLGKVLSNQAAAANLSVPFPQPRRSHSPDTTSLLSVDDFTELRLVRSTSNVSVGNVHAKTQRPGWRGRVQASWHRNRGLALVLFAMVFGTFMNVATRLLERGDDGMHPFQIIFARMSITTVISLLYMWYQKIPDFPFGAKGVRGLLVARGLGGFWGVFGLYWSLQYLPLSDATVLSFLGPPIACWACSKLINEPFTRIEQVAAVVSLLGVVFIARPAAIFSALDHASNPASPSNNTAALPPHNGRRDTNDTLATPFADPKATPQQRLAAVGMSMLGVLGAAVAYTTIRWIGQRAHPLISVTYFSTWCVIVSSVALAFVPAVPFVLPSTLRQWTLLLFIGLSGFATQFLMTAGLTYEKSSRANNMVYTQMLFALACDKIIWGVTPGVLSMVGSGLILGSAVVVAVQKETGQVGQSTPAGAREAAGRATDEETGLMDGRDDEEVEMQDQTSGMSHDAPRASVGSEEDSPLERDVISSVEQRSGDQ